MTTSEQAAIMLEAIQNNLLHVGDVVHWADNLIVSMDKPPEWLINLSTMERSHIVDFTDALREHAHTVLPLRRRVEVIVLAYDRGLLSLRDSSPLLFRVVLLERGSQALDAAGERLADALVDWDFQDDLDFIGPDLRATLEAAFRDFRDTARELMPLLVPAHRKVEHVARPNDEERD